MPTMDEYATAVEQARVRQETTDHLLARTAAMDSALMACREFLQLYDPDTPSVHSLQRRGGLIRQIDQARLR